ncbi:hypothetical protein [Deinococcus sp.]|uniref:hypothetical protein n=1 Tax=Deinococcus sp. TaxID=47478 RepID=UPI002869E3E2|nr:hypothetical protein [Deinococcus sp.]
MAGLVSDILMVHLQSLEAHGFTVQVNDSGALNITAPDGQRYDGEPVEALVPRQWAAVLGAAMSVGLTLDDLESD